jgi:tetratricopeptide (TPR) repeat protein
MSFTRLSSLVTVLALTAITATAVWAQAADPQVRSTFQSGTEAMKLAQWDEAAAAFTQVIKLSPGFAPAYFNLGLVQVQQGHPDAAVETLSRAVALSPKLRGANLFLGIAQYRKNRYPEAIAALKRETVIDPSSAKAFMWLGVAQLAAGQDSAAASSLDKAAVLDPNDVDILYHRGRAHMLLSKDSYEQMYRVAPDSWRIHEVLAQSYAQADRLEDAIKEAQLAIGLRPEEPGLHEELADIYWRQNQLEKAEAEFESELKNDPESLSAMYKLAVVSIERSKADTAAKILAEVLRRSPAYPDAHYQLGRAEAQLGHVADAISNFSAVVAQPAHSDPETVRQSYYQLAQLYRRQQKPEESRAALDSFLKLKQQADVEQSQRLQDKMKRSGQMQETAR